MRGFRSWASEQRTLFLVSSKSGSTIEPNAFQAAMGEVAPALDFIAITDPDTPLADLARAQEFRAIVTAPPDVGGRYSALSVFGLVPAALHGVDVGALLERARRMAEDCRLGRCRREPGLRLGAFIGEAALAGRDKLTILAGERLAAFGDWAEQLVAESTGKAGTGIVPIVGEPLRDADDYAGDRCFVRIHAGRRARARARPACRRARGPRPPDRAARDGGSHRGRRGVRALGGGDRGRRDRARRRPFDQPNVTESKDATTALLEAFGERGALPQPMPLVSEPGIAVSADPAAIGDAPVSVDGAVDQLLGLVARGGRLRRAPRVPAEGPPRSRRGCRRSAPGIGAATGAATTLGFGPRFLHSTGQLHKGGPDTGVFLQLTAEPSKDLPIPGWEESFGTLIAAQALGDLASLQKRGRRAIRLHVNDVHAGLSRLEAMAGATLSV